MTISEEFYISPTEVTWTEWLETRTWALENGYEDLAEGRNGRNGDESGQHPATQTSWFNAIKWCNARSEREGRRPVYYTSEELGADSVLRIGEETPFVDWDADGYRLPTEAEREYACRGGANTAFHSGDITQVDSSPIDPNLDIAGWYAGNSEDSTHPVGSKLANFFGLFDMHGNVREWCWDWYGPHEGNAIDPQGSDSGTVRIFRGGSWGESAQDCRSANRDGFSPKPATDNYGFRLVVNAGP